MERNFFTHISQLLIVMFLISIFSFVIIYIAPGDVSSMYIDPSMTEEQKAEVKRSLGMDKSLPEQYFEWAKRAITGDLGVSLANKKAVAPQIMARLPATVLLMGVSLVLSLLLAIPLGLLAGLKKNSWIDHLISAVAYIGMSIPSFWLGILLIIVFTSLLGWLPSSGMQTVGKESVPDTIQHLIMPSITLCMAHLAIFIRYIRANTVGQLSEEYVIAAKARGSSENKVLFKHVLRNSLLPVITLLGMNLPLLVCGSFVIESVFGWPGIGTLAMKAIGQRDYPMIMAYIMMSGFILVLGNFLADLFYVIVDPRIRLKGNEA